MACFPVALLHAILYSIPQRLGRPLPIAGEVADDYSQFSSQRAVFQNPGLAPSISGRIPIWSPNNPAIMAQNPASSSFFGPVIAPSPIMVSYSVPVQGNQPVVVVVPIAAASYQKGPDPITETVTQTTTVKPVTPALNETCYCPNHITAPIIVYRKNVLKGAAQINGLDNRKISRPKLRL